MKSIDHPLNMLAIASLATFAGSRFAVSVVNITPSATASALIKFLKTRFND